MAIEDGVIINLTPDQSSWFRDVRREWADQLKPFPTSDFLYQLPRIPEKVLESCRVFSDRYKLITSLPHGGTVAEIGTQYGQFAVHVLKTCHPKSMHIYDIDLSHVNDSRVFADHPQVVLTEGDSSDAISKLPEEFFDWVYIDGDHSYRGATRDAQACKKRVKVGGHLVFNDYVLWSIAECSPYGVPRAVHELIAEGGWEIVGLALNPYMHFDLALKRLE